MVRGVTADEGRDDREEHAVSVFGISTCSRACLRNIAVK